MIENMKKDLDEEIAQILHDPEKDSIKLAINEDTSYDIYFDTYDSEDERYFYIKMTENTADAPFYYIRSYTIKELHTLNKIYKVFDKNNLDDLKRYMKTLFDKNKVRLEFKENEAIIKMNIKAQLFASEELLFFELYREMIPVNEKKDKLLNIYILNKNDMKALKEITIFLNSFKGSQKDMEFIKELKSILSLKEVPGIEKVIKLEIPTGKENKYEKKELKIAKNEPKNKKIEKKIEKKEEKIEKKEEIDNENENDNRIEIIEENIIQVGDPSEDEDQKKKEEEKREKEEKNEREREIEEENENQIIEQNEIIIHEKDDDEGNDINSKIFTDLQDKYTFNSQLGKFKIILTIKNVSDEVWKANTIKLLCNEKDSTIKCSKIKNFQYDIEKGQDGDFEVRFSHKEMIKGNSYKCYLQLYVGEKKITDNDVELNIEII